MRQRSFEVCASASLPLAAEYFDFSFFFSFAFHDFQVITLKPKKKNYISRLNWQLLSHVLRLRRTRRNNTRNNNKRLSALLGGKRGQVSQRDSNSMILIKHFSFLFLSRGVPGQKTTNSQQTNTTASINSKLVEPMTQAQIVIRMLDLESQQ